MGHKFSLFEEMIGATVLLGFMFVVPLLMVFMGTPLNLGEFVLFSGVSVVVSAILSVVLLTATAVVRQLRG